MPESGPNVLLVLTDQWRAEALGCMGNDQVQTPNLDAFASENMLFERAYSPNPVCSPARACLLTGQYSHRNGITGNAYDEGWLSNEHPTMGSQLRDAGYRTGYVGKWHLGGEEPAGDYMRPGYVPPENRHGFEWWEGFNCTHAHDEGHPRVDENGDVEWLDGWQPVPQTDLAIDFLENERAESRPFFLTLSWGPPHTPFEAPEEYSRRYSPEDLELPPNVPEEMRAEARAHLAEYYAMCTSLDEEFGRLLDRLDALGLEEDTVVCVTSDHGELMGSQGLYGKREPFEESIHVPLLLGGPGIPDGHRSDAVVSLLDLMPTFLSLAGEPVPDVVQGRDLAPTLEGGDAPTSTYLQGRIGSEDAWRALRTDRYLLSVDADGGTDYLYDTQDDPYQRTNLADDPAASEIRAELREQLDAEMHRYGDAMRS